MKRACTHQIEHSIQWPGLGPSPFFLRNPPVCSRFRRGKKKNPADTAEAASVSASACADRQTPGYRGRPDDDPAASPAFTSACPSRIATTACMTSFALPAPPCRCSKATGDTSLECGDKPAAIYTYIHTEINQAAYDLSSVVP